MTTVLCFVGIDVSKSTLDVAVRPSGEAWQTANEIAALPALIARVKALLPRV